MKALWNNSITKIMVVIFLTPMKLYWGGHRAIRLPPIENHSALYVTNTMLQLFQSRGIFGGLEHENPHEHIWSFLEICSPLWLKYISQEYVWLWLFSFFLKGKGTKWFGGMPSDSISSWRETEGGILHEVLSISEDGEIAGKHPKHQVCVRGTNTWYIDEISKVFLLCPSHGLPGDVIL